MRDRRTRVQKANTINAQYIFRAAGAVLDTRDYNTEIPINEANAESLYRGVNGLDLEGRCPEHAWITVGLHGSEVLTDNPNATPLPSIDRDTILAETFPPVNGLPADRRIVRARARIKFQDDSTRSREIDVDVGHGATVSFYGGGASVSLLGPPGTLQTPEAGGLVQLSSGGGLNDLIADAVIEASISANPVAPMIQPKLIYTQTFPIDGTIGASVRVPIPPGSRRVQVYSTTAALPAVNFDAGDAMVPINVGLIPAFALSLAADGVPVPGNARDLVVGSVAGAGVLGTVVFEVYP